MKKRKLKNISAHFDRLPLVTSSILFTSLAQTLAAHLYEIYRDTVTFTYSEDRGITHVNCDVARLFVCLRLTLDCADSEHPISVHLSLDEEDTASLCISMQKACELSRKDLGMIATLGHLRFYENDDGALIQMQTRRERVLHLFAIDPASLRALFKKIDLMISEIPEEM